MTTLYWHDYETWGADPRRYRASQFAGIRTDTDLNIIGKPFVSYCKPAMDMLPHPEACLITGITPQKAMQEGICEAEFMTEIHRHMMEPETCVVGYNSLRFDDEFTRYGFYRNFIDPYEREWRNGNSRWDIIDMLRVAYALRPEGIEWPLHKDDTVSFRLEDLTSANEINKNITCGGEPHDALFDVYATIELARLVRNCQPKLYDYLFGMRDKRKVGGNLNLQEKRIMLHVSSMYPSSQGCIAPVIPLAPHPVNKNGVIVFDLRQDPDVLLDLDVEEIRERLFTPARELPEGVERLHLKTVHLNKCPVVVPVSTLTPEAAERWQINLDQAEDNAEKLRNNHSLAIKIQDVHSGREFQPINDPDQNLYGGGFFSNSDRNKMNDICTMNQNDLAKINVNFEDQRLPEMLFRYRARNWPETLVKEERARWKEFCFNRISDPEADCGIFLAEYQQYIAKKVIEPDIGDREKNILSELADWALTVTPGQ